MNPRATMRLRECRRELEEIGRNRDRRHWESDDDFVARLAKAKARELALRDEMKKLQEGE